MTINNSANKTGKWTPWKTESTYLSDESLNWYKYMNTCTSLSLHFTVVCIVPLSLIPHFSALVTAAKCTMARTLTTDHKVIVFTTSHRGRIFLTKIFTTASRYNYSKLGTRSSESEGGWNDIDNILHGVRADWSITIRVLAWDSCQADIWLWICQAVISLWIC